MRNYSIFLLAGIGACLLTVGAFAGGFGGQRGGARPAPRPAAPSFHAAPRPSVPNLGAAHFARQPQTFAPIRPSVSPRPLTSFSSASRVGGGIKPLAHPQIASGAGTGTSIRSGATTLPHVTTLPGARHSFTHTAPRASISTPNLATVRPLTPPKTAVARPSPTDVGGFLGMAKPIKPGTLPPAQPARPGQVVTHRPISIDNSHIGGNRFINKRPAWVNINSARITNIHNQWRTQIGDLHRWSGAHPDRRAHWSGWGDRVRTHWSYYPWRHYWFNQGWWNRHPHRWCGWHYGYSFYRYPWYYWWTYPSWNTVVVWFTWPAPPVTVWSQPIYYDYGAGGNVVYENNNVYINGQQVGTADEFAQSAADLATVAPPASEETAAKDDWLPLGTFAISGDPKDLEPSRIIQLAVNKNGVISGTMHNIATDQAQTIQGQVDKQTQRVAFRIGDADDIVMETGLYNLTQKEVPVLVHFGADRVETYLLVRMEQPDAAKEPPK